MTTTVSATDKQAMKAVNNVNRRNPHTLQRGAVRGAAGECAAPGCVALEALGIACGVNECWSKFDLSAKVTI